ncbi:MAG TPA: STAS domain-containing protein [Bryobacteraceae bacterium]|nr:STAS domain-containing protein [Bryobacteraceae bacterium]
MPSKRNSINARHGCLTLRAVPLSIDIEQLGEVCVLHCRGRFVPGLEADYWRSRMDDLKQLKCTKVLADFQEVAYIGSVGVAFIVGVYTSAVRGSGGRFVLTGAAPLVRRVLDLTRLSTVIPLAADLASGLAALQTKAPSTGVGC